MKRLPVNNISKCYQRLVPVTGSSLYARCNLFNASCFLFAQQTNQTRASSTCPITSVSSSSEVLENDEFASTSSLPPELVVNVLSNEQQDALELVEDGHSVFITGGAGTGKTAALLQLVSILSKQDTAITASTGLAAARLSGCTLHGFLGLAPNEETELLTVLPGLGLSWEELNQHATAPTNRLALKAKALRERLQDALVFKQHRRGKKQLKRSKATNTRIHRLRRCRVLVIDEISMVSGALFTVADLLLRAFSKGDTKLSDTVPNIFKPFGGAQLVVCGDFLQLPPVPPKGVRSSDMYAFQSPSWKLLNPHVVFLKQIFRQAQLDSPHAQAFMTALHHVRIGDPKGRDFFLKWVQEQKARASDVLTTATQQTDTSLRKHNVPLSRKGRIKKQSKASAGSTKTKANSSAKATDIHEKYLSRPVHLCARHCEVRAFNAERLGELPGKVHQYNAFNLLASATDEKPKGEELKPVSHDPLSAMDTVHTLMPRSLSLKQGTRVMLLRNVDVSAGLVNGALGLVDRFVQAQELEKLAQTQKALIIGGLRHHRSSGFFGQDTPSLSNHSRLSPSTATSQTIQNPLVLNSLRPESLHEELKDRWYPMVIFDGLPIPRVVVRESHFGARLFGKLVSSWAQIPLQHAWALSIHKSQGLTLPRVSLRLREVFAPGQVYVALSRVKTLEGLECNDLRASAFKQCPEALSFYRKLENE